MRVIFRAASQGQTFTTGSNPNGYDVTGITVRLAGLTNNAASGANQTSWNVSASLGPIVATIGKIKGTSYLLVSTQGFTAGGPVTRRLRIIHR